MMPIFSAISFRQPRCSASFAASTPTMTVGMRHKNNVKTYTPTQSSSTSIAAAKAKNAALATGIPAAIRTRKINNKKINETILSSPFQIEWATASILLQPPILKETLMFP